MPPPPPPFTLSDEGGTIFCPLLFGGGDKNLEKAELLAWKPNIK